MPLDEARYLIRLYWERPMQGEIVFCLDPSLLDGMPGIRAMEILREWTARGWWTPQEGPWSIRAGCFTDAGLDAAEALAGRVRVEARR